MTISAIFVPGLYGSTLHAELDGKQHWPSLTEIILRRRTLATDAADPLRVGRVVDRVVVVPGLYAIDVYGDALSGLRRYSGADVEWREFAYDWRRDVASQAQALDAVVDAERARGRRVALVAHSLGGLLACYYLRYATQSPEGARENWAGAAKIERVALAGVPFGGSALALIDLVEGRTVLGNDRLLCAAAYRSFAATWQLLPADPALLLDAAGKPLPFDPFEANDWQRLGLIASTDNVAQPLAQARRLHTLLTQPAQLQPQRRLPLLFVQGVGRPTLQHIVYQTHPTRGRLIDNVKQWRRIDAVAANEAQLFGDGDGVVMRSASAAPQVWQHATALQPMEIPRGHRRLLHDRTVQQRIAALLGGA